MPARARARPAASAPKPPLERSSMSRRFRPGSTKRRQCMACPGSLAGERIRFGSINEDKLFHIDQHMAEVGPGAQLRLAILALCARAGPVSGCRGTPGTRGLRRRSAAGRRRSRRAGRAARGPIGPDRPSTRSAQSRAWPTTMGSFMSVRAWAGTFDTLRRPMVENGTGMSKARNIGLRKLRRTFR